MHRPPPPGRLRLRFAALKRNPLRAASVCHCLRGIQGIQSVDASPITGSMLVQFDRKAGTSPQFWARIEAVIEGHRLHPATAGTDHAQASFPQELTQHLTEALVQRLLARSAAALVAALL